MSRVILKGLVHPDRQHLIQRMDEDDPTEVDIEVSRSVCKIMMGKKIHKTKVWVLIAQVPDGQCTSQLFVGVVRGGFIPCQIPSTLPRNRAQWY